MKLERLDIQRLPGINEAFTVRFDPDQINVITGANASGKSSLVRAVGALLYTGRATGAVSLAARWLDGEGVWTVSRTGGEVAWQFNGEPAGPPRLPDENDFDAFSLSLENLVGFSRSDQAMARQLRRELTGGFDLELLLENGLFALPPRPMKLQQDMLAAREQVRESEAEYESLDTDLRRLPELERESDTALDAGRRLDAVQAARELLERKAERRAWAAGLEAEFPPDMDLLRGDEIRRMDQLGAELAAAEDRLKNQQRRLAQLEQERAAIGIADPIGLAGLCRALNGLRSELAAAERHRDEIGERLGQARAELERAASRLDSDDPAAFSSITAEQFGRIGKAVESLLDTRIRIRELEVRIGNHPVPDDHLRQEAEHLGTARQALLAWLRTPGAAGPGPGVWGALGAAALGTFLVSALQSSWIPLLVLLPVVIAAWLLRLRSRPDAALMVRRQFEQAGLDLPRSMNEGGVMKRLAEVESRLDTVRNALALEDDHRRLKRYRREYEEQAGVLGRLTAGASFSLSDRHDAGLIAWCQHVLEFQNRSDRVKGETRALELANAGIDKLAAVIRERISAFGESAPEPLSAARLEAWIPHLEERVAAVARIDSERKQLEENRHETRERLGRLEDERRKLLAGAGLAENRADELRQRIDRLEAWRARKERLGDLVGAIRHLRERLETHPELLEQVESGDERALARKAELLSARAVRREELLRRIQDIQTRREVVLEKRALEQLNARLESLRQELRSQMETRLDIIAGRVLIDDVRKHFEQESQSQLLEQARARFARFTLGQFTLEFHADDQEPFMARSTLDGGLRHLSELSTGTRMQLLLAVRLAWIGRAEQGRATLPLFLDEVLTTADPDRFRAAVSAVGELVREGRQVFYIAAQDDDARAWLEWAAEDSNPALIDLGDVRREHQFKLEASMPVAADGRDGRIPDTAGATPAEWARSAGVPAIDPWTDPGRIHVFFVLTDDLPLVARLMRIGITEIGALDALLAHGASVDQSFDEDRRAQLRARIRAARALIEVWRRGRGRPLAPEELEECPAITPAFIARARELARSVNGNGADFLARVYKGALPRFRENNKAELDQWLVDQGHIDHTPRLDRAGILARVGAASGLDIEQVRDLVDGLVAGMNTVPGAAGQS